ncbi:ABC transporter ATP-binding protein [bacterium]|nr:MAG: ABC transporter ATP-binding protein [bacterium]
MNDLLSLNKYFYRYKGTLATGVIYLTVANLFLVFIPMMIRFAMDEVKHVVEGADKVNFSGYAQVLFQSSVGWDLAKYALLLVGAIILYGFLLFLTRQTIIVASRYIEFDIRNELYEHLQRLPMAYFATHKSGDIYVRVTEDINRVREYFGPAFMYMVNTFTRATIIIGMMFWVNAELTLWALIPLPLLSVMAYWLSGYINRMSNEIQQQYSNLAGRAQESFSSIRLIKAYVRELFEEKRFADEAEIYRKKKMILSAVEAMFFPMLNLLIGISVILVVWKGAENIQSGTATIGNIAEFIIYVAYLTWPVASLGYTLNMIQRSAASNKRIQEFLRETTDIADNEQTQALKSPIKGKIEFKNVSFTYPNTEVAALENLNFVIEPGEKIGIVGKTGSGKTSLVQLIPRLFEPTSGEILVDDIPYKRLPINELRKSIGFVPQENFLFSDTIKENIAFGVEQADFTEIELAAKKAQVLENILEFDKKFETILGERGITLSGGQKQRTSIARALIKKPCILVFDDSLSAVDTKTEDEILSYLKNELTEKTTLMISHRISTIQDCDRIFVMDNGSIVETGTHEELLTRKGVYFRIYSKQILEKELLTI